MTSISCLLTSLDSEANSIQSSYTVKQNDSQQTYDDELFLTSLALDKLNVNMDRARSLLIDIEKQNTADSTTRGTKKEKSDDFKSVFYTGRLSRQQGRNGEPVKISTPKVRSKLLSITHRLQPVELAVTEGKDRESANYIREMEQEELRAKERAILDYQKQQKEGETAAWTDSGNKNMPGSRNVPSTHSNALFASSANLGFDEKLTIEKSTQDSLASDILGLVSTLKQNALDFSQKAAEDGEFVGKTVEALDKSSGNLNKVGSRLNTYRNTTAIGWWFYIYAIIFLTLAVSASMIIVRLFPKW